MKQQIHWQPCWKFFFNPYNDHIFTDPLANHEEFNYLTIKRFFFSPSVQSIKQNGQWSKYTVETKRT